MSILSFSSNEKMIEFTLKLDDYGRKVDVNKIIKSQKSKAKQLKKKTLSEPSVPDFDMEPPLKKVRGNDIVSMLERKYCGEENEGFFQIS